MALIGKVFGAIDKGTQNNGAPESYAPQESVQTPEVDSGRIVETWVPLQKRNPIIKEAKIWEFNGEKKTAVEWAKVYGVSVTTMRERLNKYNSPEPPIRKPPVSKKERYRTLIEHKGQKKSAQEWGRELGVSPTTIRERIKKYGDISHPREVLKPIAKFNSLSLKRNGNDYIIEADGIEYLPFQFAKKFGMKYSTVYGRIKKGLPIEEIIKEAPKVNRNYQRCPSIKAKEWEWKGEKHTIQEWAKIYGIHKNMMRQRFRDHGSPERNTDRLEAYKANRSGKHTWNGETHTIKEWAAIYKVPERTMFGRWQKHNSPEHVPNTAVPECAKLWEWNGEKHSVAEWAKIFNTSESSIRRRIKATGSPYVEPKKGKTLIRKATCTIKDTKANSKSSSKLLKDKKAGKVPKSLSTRNILLKKIPESEEKYQCDGEWMTIQEWADTLGMSPRTVKQNFKKYGTPTKPVYDISDNLDDEGIEGEAEVDAILREIDNQQIHSHKKKETIHEWLKKMESEPDDERPLREILGIPDSYFEFYGVTKFDEKDYPIDLDDSDPS